MREMKDSGIEWIGLVPKSWDVKPIRAVFEEVTQKNKRGEVKNALKFTYGEIVHKSDFDADDDAYVADTILNYTIVEPGTIMLNGLNLNYDFVSQRVGLVKEEGVITSAYMAFKVTNSSYMLPEYATYLFKSYDGCKAFHNMGGGVRKILNFDEFKRYYVVIPPLSVQRDIVSFLDNRCAEINALTSDIKSQIDMLEQYKRSVITEAVTKGLNPDVEMKDSGVEWIGKIPKDWDVTKAKYHMKFLNGYAFKSKDLVSDGVYPVVRISDVKDGWIDYDNALSINNNKGLDSYKILKNDIVITMSGSIGKIGYSVEDSDAYINQRVGIIRSDISKFLFYLLSTNGFKKHMYVTSLGTTIINISGTDIGSFEIPFPSMAQQQIITDYLDEKCSNIDAILEGRKAELTTLKEYKKSLIYEYVTGKKEVPTP